jgi:hypothetical protein
LPIITEAVTMDAYTQGNATENTQTEPGRTDAVLRIQLSGGPAPEIADGLIIHGGSTTVRCMVINGFGQSGIAMRNIPGNTNNVIEGNFLGTDPTGTLDRGNGIDGVQCFGGARRAAPEARTPGRATSLRGTPATASSSTPAATPSWATW